MDYGQIIKRSWEIVKTNRFLWWLGILAAFSSGFGSSSYNFPGTRGFSGSQDSGSTSVQSMNFSKQFAEWTSQVNIPMVIGVVLAVFLCMLVLYFVVLYFSIRARAGLIVSVEKIENEGKAIGFRSAMREGGKYFWKLLGLGLLVGLVMIALVLIMVLPFGLLLLSRSGAAIGLAALVFVVLFVAFLVVCFAMSLVLILAQFMIVLDGKMVFESIRESYKLLRRHVKEVLIGYAIALGMGFVIGLAMIIPIIIIIIIGSLLGGLSYFIGGKVVAIVVASILVCIGLVFLVALGGFVTAFTTTYWTLFYRALRYIDGVKTVDGASVVSVPTSAN